MYNVNNNPLTHNAYTDKKTTQNYKTKCFKMTTHNI